MKKEITEGNKLIAEFLEWTIEPGMENEADPFYNSKAEPGFMPTMHLVSQMQFHVKWDWLMPVIEKIEKTGCIVEISYALVCNCRIVFINGKKPRVVFTSDNNGGKPCIESVYNAVTQFIHYHNSLNTSKHLYEGTRERTIVRRSHK